MCDTCTVVLSGLTVDPEIIPPIITDDMIPPAMVHDEIDRAIVGMALTRFANDYIDVAAHIASLESTDVMAQLIIMSNMTNVTDRVVRILDSIETNIIAPVCDNTDGEN